jgi:hypothetical protein
VPRTIRTFLPVVGDAAALADAFTGDPGRWLPSARRDGPDRHLLTLHAGSFTRTVTATLGSPWRAGATRWRTLAWDPVPELGDAAPVDRLLPSLDGELGLHLQPAGRVTLVLDARYHPPGGPVGAAVDLVALHRVARGTVERFLEDVTAMLSAEAMLLRRPAHDGQDHVAEPETEPHLAST